MMRIEKKIRLRFLLLLAPVLLFLSSVQATTLARLSLDQLATGSDAVARVRCAGGEARWENSSIWTVTKLQVVETMKGKLPAQISIRLPGGRVGHFVTAVDGTPKFRPGDDAIVFLAVSPAGEYTVAGWVEGTFRISIDPRNGGQTVTQDSSEFAVFDAATRTFRTEGVRRMPIDEFRAQLAAALARDRGKNR